MQLFSFIVYYIEAGIIQLMQIVSQALFERLREKPILYTSTHNRIAFITHSELVVREISIEARRTSLKIKGAEVLSISLQNSNFIVILMVNSLVEVRKVDALNDLIMSVNVMISKDAVPKLRVSSQAIYVLNKHYVDAIWLNRDRGRRKIYLQNKKEPQDLLISTIFEEQILIFQFQSSICITAQGKSIAEAPFNSVNSFKILKDPLFLGDSKQFLVVIEENRWLKVFDIFDLQQIIVMELFPDIHQQIELKTDPLNEYIMIRIYEPTTKITKRNSLLKINQDFYKGKAIEPFFLFDVEIGLKQDFILFPTHIELIQGSEFFSIDMCFFTNKQIRIASLVIDANHRSKLHNTKFSSTNWSSDSGWKDFFYAVPQDNQKEENKTKQPQIQMNNDNQVQEQWQKFIAKFYLQNLQKLKCGGFYKNNEKPNDNKKYLQFQGRYSKDLFQNEDALNTLSGSSSFGSLKELTTQLPYRLRILQGQNLSSEGSFYKDKSLINLQNSKADSQDSERDEYIKQIEKNVVDKFAIIQEHTNNLNSKIDRIEQVHLRKIKNISHNIKQHTKETLNIQKNIEKWCGQEMELFANEVKQSLKSFSTMLGRLQVMEIRSVKKHKKHYRDFLQLQIEKCSQKLQESQRTIVAIQKIVKSQERV